MIEYGMLGVAALLYQFVWFPYYVSKWWAFGPDHMVSNRDQSGLPPLPDWGARAKRAQKNYIENFPPFAVVVLLLGLVDGFTYWTGIGAVLFVLARISHVMVYTMGFVYLRSTVFSVGLGANLYLYLVFFQELGLFA